MQCTSRSENYGYVFIWESHVQYEISTMSRWYKTAVVWLERLHQLIDIDDESDSLILVHTA